MHVHVRWMINMHVGMPACPVLDRTVAKDLPPIPIKLVGFP